MFSTNPRAIDPNLLTNAQRVVVRARLEEERRKAALVVEAAVHGMRKLQDELNRRSWAAEPERWCEEKLGDSIWNGQRRIMRSVRDYRRTAAKTCHEVGKSFIAGRIAAWWIDSHKAGDAFVVTTAPTAPQVKVILWKEIGRAHTHGKLSGRVNQTEWLVERDGKEEIVAFGRKPSDYSPTAFQGIHAPFVLVIVDEANGVHGFWEAIDSVIANDDSKILLIGNPDVPQGEFYEACKPGSGYNVVEIGAFDSPNFTGEPMPQFVLKQLIGRTYVEEKRRKWAPTWRWTPDGKRCVPPPGAKPEETNPFWQSKVLGKFPMVQGDASLIPLHWIEAARTRTLTPSTADGDHRLGVDVGGGGDSSVIAEAQGFVVRIIHEDQNPDTMVTCGNVIDKLKSTGARACRVDVVGIGRGVVDRAREVLDELTLAGTRTWYPQLVSLQGVNVGEKAIDEEAYENLRAELYWDVRTLFEQGLIDIDPNDDDLAAELASIRYERISRGKIKIESKKDAKARGVPSPNKADALMLAVARSGRVTNVAMMMENVPAMPFSIPAPVMPANVLDMQRLFGR